MSNSPTKRSLASLAPCTLLWASEVAAGEFQLSLPLDCTPGKTCFVQQYVDLDPGPGVEDYACGQATYDGHKGTDFRVATLADALKGVEVLAAADGTVKGIRDGMEDVLAKTKKQRARLKGRDCGNGVLLDHGNGYETQYCHLKKGSVRVRKGDQVKRGDVLGLVGYSGAAAFAHMHLSVRKDGKTIDPFKGVFGTSKCGQGEAPLWRADTLKLLTYSPTQMISSGFSDRAVKLADLETGKQKNVAPQASSKAIVVWGWAINLLKGDLITVELRGPTGKIAKNEAALDRNKAQYMLFTGKKTPKGGWPAGAYELHFKVARNGKSVINEKNRIVIN